MATIVSPTTVTTGAAAIATGLGDEIFVASTVFLISTDSTDSTDSIGIVLAANNGATVQGTVAADGFGILMGQEVAGGRVFVATNGQVTGANEAAIAGGLADDLSSGNYTVVNNGDIGSGGIDGTIRFVGPGDLTLQDSTFVIENHNLITNYATAGDGIAINLKSVGTTSRITNSADGIISASMPGGIGILVEGQLLGDDSATVVELYNDGLIVGGQQSYSAAGGIYGSSVIYNQGEMRGNVKTAWSNDAIYNSGLIVGNVSMGPGDDLYDGRGGTVTRSVMGQKGNDAYIVDNATIDLRELENQGTDTVFSTVGWTLGDHFEILTLAGDGDITGEGNDAANTITGNIGDNTLIGNDGNDVMSGGDGNDIVFGDGGVDDISGDAGDDWLIGGLSNDRIDGGDGDDILRGQGGSDVLNGGRGNDVLTGGVGRDRMSGGADADLFIYTSIRHSTNDPDADSIVDFEIDLDRIDLSYLSADPLVFVGDDAFLGGGTGSVRTTVTNGVNTVVRVDVDGDGTADMRIGLLDTVGVDGLDFLL